MRSIKERGKGQLIRKFHSIAPSGGRNKSTVRHTPPVEATPQKEGED
jgi:hypothetical protein